MQEVIFGGSVCLLLASERQRFSSRHLDLGCNRSRRCRRSFKLRLKPSLPLTSTLKLPRVLTWCRFLPTPGRGPDAYFEGGYWMILWDFLYGAAILLLLLNLGGRRPCGIWQTV